METSRATKPSNDAPRSKKAQAARKAAFLPGSVQGQIESAIDRHRRRIEEYEAAHPEESDVTANTG